MGTVIPARALLFLAMLASLALAALSVQTWAHLEVRDTFQGYRYPVTPVPGTQLTALTSAGDGKILLVGSIMTLALSVVALISVEARRLATGGLALGGLFLLAISIYVATHMQRAGDYDFWVTGTRLDYPPTIAPILAIASAAGISVAGVIALLLTPKAAEARTQLPVETFGPLIEPVLRLIVWLTATLAVLAFVPWIDKHTVHILIENGPIAMTALGDAVLFASVATACALLAYQMLRDPSELVWAGLVVGSGALFVVAGSEIADSARGCSNNGTILGLMSGNILGSCNRGGDAYSLSAGTAVGWIALIGSTLVALLGLALPIIELVSGNGEPGERSEQW